MGALSYMGDMIGATPPIDDSSVSDKKLWSSQKINNVTSSEITNISTYSSLFKSGAVLRLRKVGNIVVLNYMLSPAADIAGSYTDIEVCTLPFTFITGTAWVTQIEVLSDNSMGNPYFINMTSGNKFLLSNQLKLSKDSMLRGQIVTTID